MMTFSSEIERANVIKKNRRIRELAPLMLALLGAVTSFSSCGSSKQETRSQETASQPSASAQGESGAQPGVVAITDAARMQAKDLFSSRCSACHGPEGRGNGPGAANLNPKPQNFHDQAWQKSVTNEQIEQAILYGGSAVGKSPLMVPNPDLQSQPAVVAALREHIRQLGTSK